MKCTHTSDYQCVLCSKCYAHGHRQEIGSDRFYWWICENGERHRVVNHLNRPPEIVVKEEKK